MTTYTNIDRIYAGETAVNESASANGISVNAAYRLCGKGGAIGLIGATQSGKSSFVESLAKSDAVMSLLSMREANGKGTTANTEITVTDSVDIPEDKLIVMGELIPKNLADITDDNAAFGELLFSVTKAYEKNPMNAGEWARRCGKALDASLEKPANESLFYKLRSLTKAENAQLKDRLAEKLAAFDPEKLCMLYREAMAAKKKGRGNTSAFISLVSGYEGFAGNIAELWERTLEIVNSELNGFIEELRSFGAYAEDYCGGIRFAAALGEGDMGSELAADLLMSEDGSKEYLIGNLRIMFRGNDRLFSGENAAQFAVARAESAGGEAADVHCIRLIDTQGLFHAQGVTVKDEAERIGDILAEYHVCKVLVIMNSFVSNTTKNAAEALATFLREANRSVDVAILYTHWDEYLDSFGKQGVANKFGRPAAEIDWSKKYAEADGEQRKNTERLKESVSQNDNKRRPAIIGTYRAAIVSEESARNRVLADNDILYPVASQKIFDGFAAADRANGAKFRVRGSADDKVFDIHDIGALDVSRLYDNLMECKRSCSDESSRLYAATVRACVRKWCDAGAEHISDVAANYNGFVNIRTAFVTYTRNIGQGILQRNVELDVRDVLAEDRIPEFLGALESFCAANIGRELAVIIGGEAYRGAFIRAGGFRFQWQRFNAMLTYVQERYFGAKSADANALLPEFNAALTKCVSEFIDTRCIVAY